jgi:hypothetical protein
MEWVEKTDEKSGRVYYLNIATRQTSWTKPSDEMGQATTLAQPTDWTEKTDPKTGKVYYFNKTTKQTSWVRPSESETLRSTPPPASAPPVQGSEWLEKLDPKSGKVYYFDKVTKQTSWTKPEGTDTAFTEAESLSDWVEKLDPTSGKTYYFNKSTKQTNWVKPGTTSQAEKTEAHSDWIEKLDRQTNKVYYYNKATKQTSWTKPEVTHADSASAEAAAQPAWLEQVDAATGKVYYLDPVTKQTTWTKPEITSSPTKDTPDRTASTTPQPDGGDWVEKIDKTNRKPYYYNKTTGQTTWTKPAQLVPTGVETDPLPSGWLEKTDIVTGQKYYLHTLTKQPSWVRPTVTQAENDRATRIAEDGGDERAYVTTSIEGRWEKRFEPRSGSFYYFNTKTHETRWDVTASGSTIAVDVSAVDTVYLFGGQPHTTTVLKYDGGQLGWIECHAMQLPFELDTPFVWKDGDSIVVGGTRPAIGADVMVTVKLPQHTDTATTAGAGVTHISGEVPCRVRTGMAVAAVSGGMIVSGGYDDLPKRLVSTECMVMDTQSRRSIPLPPLQVRRASHALAVVDLSTDKSLAWYAFAIGGFDGTMKTNVVERYVLGQPYWEIISPMRTPRAAHGAVAVEKSVYVFGGRSGYTVLNTGEYMHCQSTGWMETAPMRVSRCSFGVAAVHSFIFCVGGWSGTEWLASVEAYDIRLDTWREVHSLPSPRGGFALLKALFSRPPSVPDPRKQKKAAAKAGERTLAEQIAADLYKRR